VRIIPYPVAGHPPARYNLNAMPQSAAAQLAETCRTAHQAVANMRVLQQLVHLECSRSLELVVQSERAVNRTQADTLRSVCLERREFIAKLLEAANQSSALSHKLSAATRRKDDAAFTSCLEACMGSRKNYISIWQEYQVHRRQCGYCRAGQRTLKAAGTGVAGSR